ncbi:MAG TPA: type II 3-dehydroquinate dehydratase [Eubacteriales bacterium]|nr:type II 3-dehydroquinate dehydratase [Eubacteriales bacterium]
MKILIINGVNLNMLGRRDRAIYGDLTLKELNFAVKKYASAKQAKTEFFFSNSESEIVSKLQKTHADGVILNAGAYSHYSYAIRDCIESINKPVIEVHLSDIENREDFRKIRVFDGVVKKCFYGEKEKSYFKAVDYLCGL